MKIVINTCFGGFELSDECAVALGAKIVTSELGFTYHNWGADDETYWCDTDQRTNPELIKLMETKGSKWCSGAYASLKVVEIPDGVDWEITDYDGAETIEEVHRSWS